MLEARSVWAALDPSWYLEKKKWDFKAQIVRRAIITAQHTLLWSSNVYVYVFMQDLKRKYMEKREKGELTIQKIDYLKYNILRPVTWIWEEQSGSDDDDEDDEKGLCVFRWIYP